jgi:hypothetical protein
MFRTVIRACRRSIPSSWRHWPDIPTSSRGLYVRPLTNLKYAQRPPTVRATAVTTVPTMPTTDWMSPSRPMSLLTTAVCLNTEPRGQEAGGDHPGARIRSYSSRYRRRRHGLEPGHRRTGPTPLPTLRTVCNRRPDPHPVGDRVRDPPPAVTSAIIGPRTAEHLDTYLAADGIDLSSDVLDRIDQIVPPRSRSTSPTTCGTPGPPRLRPHSAAGRATVPRFCPRVALGRQQPAQRHRETAEVVRWHAFSGRGRWRHQAHVDNGEYFRYSGDIPFSCSCGSQRIRSPDGRDTSVRPPAIGDVPHPGPWSDRCAAGAYGAQQSVRNRGHRGPGPSRAVNWSGLRHLAGTPHPGQPTDRK